MGGRYGNGEVEEMGKKYLSYLHLLPYSLDCRCKDLVHLEFEVVGAEFQRQIDSATPAP